MKENEFRPLEKILRNTTIAIWINVVAAFLLLVPLAIRSLMSNVAPELDNFARYAILGLFGVQILSGLCAGIMFMMWMYTAFLNAILFTDPESSEQQRKTASIDVVGGFLVPIYNFFKPYQNMCKLWRTSDPAVAPGTAWQELPVPSSIGLWWGAYLGAIVLDRIAGQLTGPVMFSLEVGYALLRLTAGLLVIQLAGGITERQVKKIATIKDANLSR